MTTRRYVVLLIAVALVLLFALGLVLSNLVRSSSDRVTSLSAEIDATAFKDPKDRIAAKQAMLQSETDNEIKIVGTVAQAFLGLGIISGAVFGWLNLKQAQDKLQLDQRSAAMQLRNTRQSQTADRFARAVEQLGYRGEGQDRGAAASGSTFEVVRLGGIYALESIAADSAADYLARLSDAAREYWPAMQVLTAYVRHYARLETTALAERSGPPALAPSRPHPRYGPPPDIQAILDVLARRPWHFGEGEESEDYGRDEDVETDELGQQEDEEGSHARVLRLHRTDLRGALLRRAHLEHARLRRTNLDHARLEGCFLTQARLRFATLRFAHLEYARLDGAHLQGADLQGAYLKGAVLTGARLFRADFHGARDVETVTAGWIEVGTPQSPSRLEGPDALAYLKQRVIDAPVKIRPPA